MVRIPFQTSIITWASYCNKYPLLYICIYIIGSLNRRILTNTGGKEFDILGELQGGQCGWME